MNEKRIQKTSFMVFVFQAWILNVFKGFRMYLKYPETAFGFTQFSHSAFTWLVYIATWKMENYLYQVMLFRKSYSENSGKS